jgi:hypothetical protein
MCVEAIQVEMKASHKEMKADQEKMEDMIKTSQEQMRDEIEAGLEELKTNQKKAECIKAMHLLTTLQGSLKERCMRRLSRQLRADLGTSLWL